MLCRPYAHSSFEQSPSANLPVCADMPPHADRMTTWLLWITGYCSSRTENITLHRTCFELLVGTRVKQWKCGGGGGGGEKQLSCPTTLQRCGKMLFLSALCAKACLLSYRLRTTPPKAGQFLLPTLRPPMPDLRSKARKRYGDPAKAMKALVAMEKV